MDFLRFSVRGPLDVLRIWGAAYIPAAVTRAPRSWAAACSLCGKPLAQAKSAEDRVRILLGVGESGRWLQIEVPEDREPQIDQCCNEKSRAKDENALRVRRQRRVLVVGQSKDFENAGIFRRREASGSNRSSPMNCRYSGPAK
jgi:hypothetical protein